MHLCGMEAQLLIMLPVRQLLPVNTGSRRKELFFLFFLWRNFIVLLTITREKKAALCLSLLFLQLRHTCGVWITSAMINVDEKIIHSQPLNQKCSKLRCLLRVKGLVICFYLGWQYSSVQTKYDKGRFKVMATYLQQ